VDDAGRSGRLFTAEVERVRATWSFDSRSFVRLVGQYVQTRRDTSLYTFGTSPKTADLSASALFAYKLNWQTFSTPATETTAASSTSPSASKERTAGLREDLLRLAG